MNPPARLVLKPERSRPVELHHPWVLSGSVARVEGDPEPGATVSVVSAAGVTLGIGDYDPSSQIRVRIHTFGNADADPDEKWLGERLRLAVRWREGHPELGETDALRLVHAEGDGLPGLVVDRYADCLVLKAGTPAMVHRADRIARDLAAATGVRRAGLRGNAGGPDARVEARALLGEPPETATSIDERGRRYHVDLRRGQKTGFYLDQRDARDLVRKLAVGGLVLDLYAYSGGFSVAALQGGARGVVAVESSSPALELLELNAPEAERVKADVGEFLRDDERRFDLIVCDPPPLARRQRDVRAACGAYKDMNMAALRRAADGAHMLTFTCSHHIDADLFRKVIFGAAEDAGANLQVLSALGAAPDHPVSLRHPQGEYLKGLLLRVVEPGS